MRLVGEARFQCHLGNRPALAQLRPRILHPLIQQITVWGQAEALAECTNQVGAGQAASRADICQAQRVAPVRTNERRSRIQLRVLAAHVLRTGMQITGKIGEKAASRASRSCNRASNKSANSCSSRLYNPAETLNVCAGRTKPRASNHGMSTNSIRYDQGCPAIGLQVCTTPGFIKTVVPAITST